MTNTPSPSPEEVVKAQEWLITHAEACVDVDCSCLPVLEDDGQKLAELLASYAAEQGRPTKQELAVLRDDYRILMIARDQKADDSQAAESRLTSLREGLRRMEEWFVWAATARSLLAVFRDREHDAGKPYGDIQGALIVYDILKAEAESLLAGLSEEGGK